MAIEDRDVADAFVAQIAKRFLGRLAGAQDQSRLVVEPLEDTPGEIGHRHARHADAALMQGRFRGHASRRASAPPERPRATAARPPPLDRRLIRLLHLGRNLRFAQHHAVEARRHAEQMPHGRLFLMPVQMFDRFGWIEAVKSGQEIGDLFQRRFRGAFRGRVNFHAIAGRKQHGLDARKPRRQRSSPRGLVRPRTPVAHAPRSTPHDDCNRRPALAWRASGGQHGIVGQTQRDTPSFI